MKPASKTSIEALINIERMKYNVTSTPTLQWLLRMTKLQMNTVTNRALYHQARIVHEAVRREVEFRNQVIKDELQLAEQWDLDCEDVATQRDDIGSGL
jgi:hypothetical protein